MNKEKLFKNIQRQIMISEQEFALISDFFQYESISKKEKLIEEGKSNNKLYFIEKGLLYSYKTLDSGDIQVIQFAKENYWISDLGSFFSNSKVLFSIRALEACTLLTISRQDFDAVFEQFPRMETCFRLNFQQAYENTLIRLSDIYLQDSMFKYNLFKEKYPDLLQRVPQYLIASYLGILPSSLSRIRSKK